MKNDVPISDERIRELFWFLFDWVTYVVKSNGYRYTLKRIGFSDDEISTLLEEDKI